METDTPNNNHPKKRNISCLDKNIFSVGKTGILNHDMEEYEGIEETIAELEYEGKIVICAPSNKFFKYHNGEGCDYIIVPGYVNSNSFVTIEGVLAKKVKPITSKREKEDIEYIIKKHMYENAKVVFLPEENTKS